MYIFLVKHEHLKPKMSGDSDLALSHLPWGANRERSNFPESVYINPNVKPGEYVLQTLFAEFTVLAEKKIQLVLEEKDNKVKT